MNSFNFLYWFFFSIKRLLKRRISKQVATIQRKKIWTFSTARRQRPRETIIYILYFFCVSHFPNFFHNITNKQKALKAFTSHTTLTTIVTHLIFCLLIITNKQNEIANDHATTVKLLSQWLGEALYLHFMLKGNKWYKVFKKNQNHGLWMSFWPPYTLAS